MRTHRNNNEILCNVIEIKYESFSNEFMNLQGGGGGRGGGLQLVCGRPTHALSSALVPQTLSCLVCMEDS